MSGKSEFMLFTPELPQIVVESAYFAELMPQNALGGLSVGAGTLVFNILGTEDEYLDMNDTLFEFDVRIVKGTGKPLDSTSTHHFVNHAMHSLFSDVKVLANNVIIEGGNNNYPYKAVIENMLGFDEITRQIQLESTGYDTSADNRKKWTAESKVVKFLGMLRVDVFKQVKPFPPGVDLKIMLTPSKSKFCIEGARGDSEPRVDFIAAKMHVRRVRVSPSVALGHQLGVQKQNFIYSYTSGRVVTFSVPVSSSNYTFEPVFPRSILPKFVVVALVDAKAYSGDSATVNPFKFNHFDVNTVGLYLNGQCIPYSRPYEISDWATGNDWKTAYVKSLLHETLHLNNNVNNGITPANFHAGEYTFFCYNLAADNDYTTRQPIKDGSLRLDLKFNKTLGQAINVIVYGMFDCDVQITADKSVIPDPNVF